MSTNQKSLVLKLEAEKKVNPPTSAELIDMEVRHQESLMREFQESEEASKAIMKKLREEELRLRKEQIKILRTQEKILKTRQIIAEKMGATCEDFFKLLENKCQDISAWENATEKAYAGLVGLCDYYYTNHVVPDFSNNDTTFLTHLKEVRDNVKKVQNYLTENKGKVDFNTLQALNPFAEPNNTSNPSAADQKTLGDSLKQPTANAAATDTSAVTAVAPAPVTFSAAGAGSGGQAAILSATTPSVAAENVHANAAGGSMKENTTKNTTAENTVASGSTPKV